MKAEANKKVEETIKKGYMFTKIYRNNMAGSFLLFRGAHLNDDQIT